jgi:hypothetical protein
MAVLVIAGSGRSAGKTAVGCALVRALEELCWTAVKVTPHLHRTDEPVWEDQDMSSPHDTGRYLAAGAKHAYLVEGTTPSDSVLANLAAIRDRDCRSGDLLVESNRVPPEWIARHGERSLCLALLKGPPCDWKVSLMERASRADALVLTSGFCCDELPPELRGKRAFQMVPGHWSSPELVGFVRRELLRSTPVPFS